MRSKSFEMHEVKEIGRKEAGESRGFCFPVTLLPATHCTSTQRLVLPDYQLAGFSLSRKHGLATFDHKRLKWTRFEQSRLTSETE